MLGEADARGSVPTGNKLLHAALDSMSYAFSVWDHAHRLILYNQIYDDMYYSRKRGLRPGMRLQEVCALSIENGNHPGYSAEGLAAKYRGRFEETSAPGARNEYEKRIHDRLIRAAHIRTEGVGWIVTHEDITEKVKRKQAEVERESALAMQNMRFAAAVDNMAHGHCMFGPDRRLVICNRVFARMYGLPEHMVKPGVSLDAIIAHRNANRPPASEGDAHGGEFEPMESAAGLNREHRYIVHEGGRVIAVYHKRMPDGGWVATHQDITEQRQREALIEKRSREFEQQNMRFDAAVNNMSHGLSLFDADRRLVVCNQAYQELYGLPDEMTKPGTSFWDMLDCGARAGMVAIENPEERRTVLEREIAAGKLVQTPITMVNGTIVMARHQPLPDGGWLATHEDITEQRRSQQMVEHLARHDSLTGLPNRSSFLEAMARAETRIAQGEQLAVLCIDLDRFKPINDNFGHAAGDAVLTMVASRISAQIGDGGIAARLGGDEFAVLTGPVNGGGEAAAIARRIIAAVEEYFCWEGYELSLGASIGVALAPRDGQDTDTLMRHGDLALYTVKSESRGSVCVFEPEMAELLEKRRTMEAGLKEALQKGEISLNFQPLFDLATARISGCETLMRWTSSRLGSVPPSEFIPVAEETGLIRELGAWALNRACMAAAGWPEAVRVAVNVSPVQFKSNDLVATVIAALERSGLAPERLELEITESLFLAENEHTLEILHALKRLGVGIALDDFGTGYSSLSYLRSFPFDKIKIDRSFVSSLGARPDNAPIIKAVVDLGRSLGMSTVAEGVETELQMNTLTALGCTQIQGYFISPPLPQTRLGDLLGRRNRTPVRKRA